MTRTESGASFAIPAAPPADNEGDKENRVDPVPASPLSTPTSTRRSQRRSKFLTPRKKLVEVNVDDLEGPAPPKVGCGRAIPVRQGSLLKKSNGGGFSREWKKKYVALCDDATLTYHVGLQVRANHSRTHS